MKKSKIMLHGYTQQCSLYKTEDSYSKDRHCKKQKTDIGKDVKTRFDTSNYEL